ncbi:uncharacterized protein THITE_40294 [Thermothielavioides terrestris NRRL 8126]|uniref:Uncharacterized protein n=1 Tax=Thermothielavioides terrestris (strain ATCC 38088 / NRRL 8126) TaxID=578455 RepID=G2QW70_THETT|nr:uncharacterized protein THITE_40294 [Thermothielavioides terrestris NRRL 8126]AEO63045.1 hypothetical protein THITE_40294 [Thermothielavioides terrestris NRRL 8126]
MELEIKQATRLLQAQRAADRDEQPLTWLRNRFSSQAGAEFTAREVNKVLAEVVEADGSVGVVKGLLALGADVNFVRRRHSTTWSKITQRSDPGERNNVLLRATIRCRPETVHVLAAHADQVNLDSVLHHAIARGNLAVLAALLEHGASPVHLHDDFQEVVYRNQVDLLRVLLSGHHLPCLACRSTGLRIAVENQSLEVIRLLLDHWADVNYGDAVALTRAVELSRPDLVALLISGTVQPSARSLDAAIGKLRQMMGERAGTSDHQILELLLSAGATGPETSRLEIEGLVEAVKRRQTLLLNIILRYKRPPGQYEAAALVEAIRAEQLDILAKLLEFKPSSASLTIAVSQSVGLGSPSFRYEATRLLIEAGAQGPCAADALIKTVHCLVADAKRGDKVSTERNMRLFYLLLHEGNADVNAAKGEALQIAVRSACVEVAEEIVAKEPSPESLGAALGWAMAVPDGHKKQALVELLVRHQINEDAAGKALVSVFKGEPGNSALVELLLTRASVNYNNGEVFIYAIRNFRPETFHLLLSQGIEYKPLFTAVLEALKTSRPERITLFGELLSRLQLDHLNMALKHVVLEEQTDLALAKMLLDSGAEAALEDGLCVKHAASTLDRDLLRLLSEYLDHDGNIYGQAFAAIISRGTQWIAFEHVDVVDILLQRGASGPIVSKALVEVVDHLACQEPKAGLAGVMLRRLFAANADVNHENGKAMSIAASRGDPFLLSLLLANGATSSSATLALTAAIMAHHREALLLQLISIFADKSSVTPDFNRSIPGMPPPILLCLKSYGSSTAILDGLVKAGCHLEVTIPMRLYAESARNRENRVVSSELEPASVLMWALAQEEGLISPAVIKALIHHGADISYTTPKTRTTPLLLAVKFGLIDVVQMLIDAGARVSAKDAAGRSALFYASRAGNSEMVKLLLKAKPVVNDGSLHEASRGFHLQVMKRLLEAGHDPNYRSIKHGGRTALGEIALKANAPSDVAVAEECLDLLASVDASPLLKVHGKTVIFLALDNQHNEAITRLLLDRVLYRTLNSHENTYQQGTLHYSPTVYVSKGILSGPCSDALLQLLKAHGCEDRFYASMEETQPPDAVGLPEEIREYERERRARERQNRLMEEEHANTIRREREKAIALAQLEDDKHYRTLQHREDVSQQQRRHRGLDHHQAILMAAEKHHNDSQIKLSQAAVNSTIRWQRHNDDIAMLNQKREADRFHRHETHQQQLAHRRDKLQFATEAKNVRHAQSLAHLRDRQRQAWQAWQAREDRRAQQLAWENRRMVQEYEQLCRKAQLGREARHEGLAGLRESHEMKMTELRTQRGNIIGQVNLEELRRWQQESERKANLAPVQGKLLAG